MRNFKINVEVIPDHAFGTCVDTRDCSIGLYKVIIDPEQIERMGVADYAAAFHEFGHILGMEFGFPKQAYGIRCEEQGIIESENEAWDIAEAMVRLQKGRSAGIESYKSSFEERRRIMAALASFELKK